MVRKHSKQGVKTGNSLGLGLHLTDARKHGVHQFAIYKYYRSHGQEPAPQQKEAMEALDKQLRKYVDDGGIRLGSENWNIFRWWWQRRPNDSEAVCHSMNKKKRWLLPKLLKRAVDDIKDASESWDAQEVCADGDSRAGKDWASKTSPLEQDTKANNVRLVVLERATHPFGGYRKTFSGRYRTKTASSHLQAPDADCSGYHDSSLEDTHLHPEKRRYGYWSHMKRIAQEKAKLRKDAESGAASRLAEEEEKKKRRKNPGKARGRQRNPNVGRPREEVEEEANENRWVFMAHPTGNGDNGNNGDNNEIRYEVCYPQPVIAHWRHRFHNAKNDPDSNCAPSRKSRVKRKGHCVRRQFGVYTKRDLNTFDPSELQLDHDCVGEDGEGAPLEETSYSEKATVVVDLSEMLPVKSSKKKEKEKRRKARKRTANSPVIHANRACGVVSGYRGKGSATWIDPPEADTEVASLTESGADGAFADSLSTASLSSSPPPDAWRSAETEEVSTQCITSIENTRPASLEADFGQRYIEARCLPRRFAIHLSGEAWEASYVLFQLHGAREKEEYETASVMLKGAHSTTLAQDVVRNVNTCDVIQVTELVRVFSDVIGSDDKHRDVAPACALQQSDSFGNFRHIIGWRSEAYTLKEAYLVAADEPFATLVQTPSRQNSASSDEGIGESEQCQICFEDINAPGGVHGSALRDCRHWFCNQCWALHLVERIRRGDNSLTCPGYKCQQPVDNTTLLSLVPYGLYIKHVERVHNRKLERNGHWKWCPNSACGRLVRMGAGSAANQGRLSLPGGTDAVAENTPVHCQCGETWCFGCQRDAHWPASCSQAEAYHKKVIQTGVDRGPGSEQSVFLYVDVKRCPSCHYPLEKAGGCQYMRCCRCHYEFCWECLNSWSSHGSLLRCPTNKRSEITVELDSNDIVAVRERFYKQAVSHRQRRRRPEVTKSLPRKLQILARSIMLTQTGQPADTPGVKPYQRFQLCYGCEYEYRVLTEAADFSLQAHFMLEYVSVVLSNCSRRTRCKGLRCRVSRLQFVVSRIEETLEEPKRRDLPLVIPKIQSWIQTAMQLVAEISVRVSRTQRKLAAVSSKSVKFAGT